MEQNETPKGYWKNAHGTLTPEDKVKPIDKLRHTTVVRLAEQATALSAAITAFKFEAMQTVQAFVDQSLAEYDVRCGGQKGNVTLLSYDGKYKIVRQMQESIAFDERLQAAKELIDECIHEWSKGSSSNIKVLVNQAFQVDKEGKISTGRVLGLRNLDIKDEKWLSAMTAIADSMQVLSTKPYIRFYQCDEVGAYRPILLDIAGV